MHRSYLLRLSSHYNGRNCIIKRSLFSQTGVFPNKLNDEDLHAMESYWKPKIPDMVASAQNELPNDATTKYILSMFPYPSGQLHMGHVRVYAISDAMAHYHRMMKHKVIHPMGWDAFGLPAENAAIAHQIKPSIWTRQNIETMKSQLDQMACLFDWEREFATCDPKYYKWTQYLFIKMFKSGLAYQKEAMVNWDPIDQTVLADEQVDDKGRSWRSGALVLKQPLRQWFLKTTQFSKNLYDGLDDPCLHNWKDIIAIQKNWIGQCNGTNIDFRIESQNDSILTVWTDKPEMLCGVAFIGLTKNHILDRKEFHLHSNNGLMPLNIYAINPFTQMRIPILVSDEFSEDFLGIPESFEEHKIIADKVNINYRPKALNETGDFINDQFKGLTKQHAREKSMELLRNLKIGGHWTSSRLRDWLISRQRYWGTPIPIIHCSNCGPVPVPETDLPVELPELDTISVKGTSPLLQAEDWINTPCPACGVSAKRETDTMDTFVDSSWYFARYLDPKNENSPISHEASKNLPVDLYIGGKEHATLHMYFARFFTHFMNSIGLSPVKEPFQSLLVQGMVKGKSYRVKGTGQYLHESKVDTLAKIETGTGKPIVEEWEKMSKSKHNGVDPGEIIRQYGSDTTKLLILSDVSPQSDRKWNPEDSHIRIQNMQRRIWKLVHQSIEKHQVENIPELSKEKFQEQEAKCWDARNFYVRGANQAYRETRNFAMVQARVQGLLSDIWPCHSIIKRDSGEFQKALATAIILLAPMAPHFCSELWSGLAQGVPVKHCQDDFHWEKSVFHQPWPELDANYNLKLIVNKNDEVLSEIPVALWKFREMEAQDAFDLACCDNKVLDEILSKVKDFKHTFIKFQDYEAILNFHVPLPKLSKEELKQMRQEEKEKKLLKKLAREKRKAKNEADTKAKQGNKKL